MIKSAWLQQWIAGELPQLHRSNFLHLYFDIAWFGVLSGSTIAFLSVYMVRLGASGFEIGLVNALPGLVTLLLALPAGWWLKSRPLDKSVFRASVVFRFFYFLWVPMPLLFTARLQIELLIGITFIMSIPGTALAVGFNAMFAEAVPPEWRGKVVGWRNALLALTYTSTSLICGFLLDRFSSPWGYSLIFCMGFIGAALSSYHLSQIHLPVTSAPMISPGRLQRSLGLPGQVRTFGDAVRSGAALRYLVRLPRRAMKITAFPRQTFGYTLVSLFIFHFTQHMAIPLYPLYWVNQLKLSDLNISIGNALFYIFLFAGSTQLAYLTRRWGNHRVAVLGAILLSIYPALTAVSQNISMYLLTATMGGLFAALSAGAIVNYLLEKVPEDERPVYLAWYVISLNAAILLGSLVGPFMAERSGLVIALILSAVGRLVSGLILWVGEK